MRSEGESHPSLANTSLQKMIKMTPVDSVLPLGLRVGWSVREVWAAHGSMRCISSINTGSVFLFIQSPVVITLSFCCQYFSSLITPLRFAGARMRLLRAHGLACLFVLHTMAQGVFTSNLTLSYNHSFSHFFPALTSHNNIFAAPAVVLESVFHSCFQPPHFYDDMLAEDSEVRKRSERRQRGRKG